jgi:hypothetical protein
VIPDPSFVDLPVYDAVELDAGNLHLLAGGEDPQKPLLMGTASRPAGYHYFPLVYLVFCSEMELGAGGAKRCRVLFNALTPVYLSDEARIVEDVVEG